MIDEHIKVRIPHTVQGKTETEDYTVEKVLEKYELLPQKLIEVKGLAGDSSDNIPGIPGVGEKTAITLIKEYGNIEGIYKNPESLSRAERGKVTMRDSRLIRLFKKLGIEKCRYNGFVVTDKYEDLELKQQIDILISRNCDTEAEEKLEELKRRLDLSIAENRRTIQGYEIAIGIEKKKGPRKSC